MDHRWILATYVPPQAFAAGTRGALVRLGYRVVAAATRGSFDDASWRPDVRLVDERHLARLPGSDDTTPIIAVAGPNGESAQDTRLVGRVARPVEVRALYPLLQDALESHPRRAARAPARIPARGSRSDRRFSGEVVSLSETGCLFRSESSLEPGLEFNLLFPLPLGRMVSTRAKVLCRAAPQSAGLAFHNPSPQACRAIADYVTRRLATL